jgi:mannose-6-phosphate isomerase-like protein (cupin superfamily)
MGEDQPTIEAAAKSPSVVDFAQVAPVECPCGIARRAFADVEGFPATVHRTDISRDARTHYHRRITEVYYFLECEADAQMQLDRRMIPVKPGMCILIPPGVRHRAVGSMKVLIVATPKFDPDDEWFDEPPGAGAAEQGDRAGTD